MLCQALAASSASFMSLSKVQRRTPFCSLIKCPCNGVCHIYTMHFLTWKYNESETSCLASLGLKSMVSVRPIWIRVFQKKTDFFLSFRNTLIWKEHTNWTTRTYLKRQCMFGSPWILTHSLRCCGEVMLTFRLHKQLLLSNMRPRWFTFLDHILAERK